MSSIQAAGLRNRRITFKERVTTDEVISWANIGTDHTVWASLTPIAPTDTWRFGQAVSELTHRVEVLHRTDISSDDRIYYGSRIFQIVGIPFSPGDAKYSLVIYCKEIRG